LDLASITHATNDTHTYILGIYYDDDDDNNNNKAKFFLYYWSAGEIEELIADPIEKSHFIPLSDSLCWAIHELTSSG